MEQAGRLWHTSNAFYSEPPLRLAEELVTASRFARRVFLCNSGAEANEAAIKLVRKWASGEGRSPQQRVIVTCRGSFHGRTLAAVTATAQPKYQAGYEPLPQGFRYVDFNDLTGLEVAMAAGDVAAVMLEPVQGEGGVTPVAPGYLRAVRELCDRHGALLVLDEIQCGMGRTGTLFAHWQDDVVPDIVTLAKALGGGFPVGAMLAGPKVADVMQFGAHGTTFGGNPLASAVARVALRKLSSPEVAANVTRQSRALRDGLQAIDAELQVFSEVRGRGLMLGAVLGKDFAGQAGAILDHAAEHGRHQHADHDGGDGVDIRQCELAGHGLADLGQDAHAIGSGNGDGMWHGSGIGDIGWALGGAARSVGRTRSPTGEQVVMRSPGGAATSAKRCVPRERRVRPLKPRGAPARSTAWPDTGARR